MKEIKNIPASISARLQNLARAQNKPFQEILQYYAIERFLFRISKSNYANLFVLKGGLIFYALGLSLRRSTRDIDFRGYSENKIDFIQEVIKTTFSVPVLDDGLVFDGKSTRYVETMPNADHFGIRIDFEAKLGRSIIPIQIDIGFSDVITPNAEYGPYPVMLENMETPIIKMYPEETIISEKFQAIVRLAEINSRWKDYYDLWMLSELHNFNGTLVQNAINATFEQRYTPIPKSIPSALTDSFARSHQKNWITFLTRNKILQTNNEDFGIVIDRLRRFLLPPTHSLNEYIVFTLNWGAGSTWS